MKVTKNRIKVVAAWAVLRNLRVVLLDAYFKFYDPMLRAYLKNPNIKWR